MHDERKDTMWIKHVILENFASIKVGMKTDRLEIDFSNRKNKICLLVAPNGTGKTSVLSTLTPFATLGNLDVRDSDNLIITGKSGYKEILIIDNDDEYLIKHFYSPNKERHSVKSYISKNGEELNVNGNVRSFQSIVENELGLEISFLKLIRLGNNVTNLLQMTATERKKFLSNLLSDLDVYLNIHKKLTDDAKVLKAQLSHLTDKLKRIGVSDKETIEKAIEQLEHEIKSLTADRESILSRIAVTQSKLGEIDYSSEKSQMNILKKKLDKMNKRLSDFTGNTDVSEYKAKYDKIKAKIQELTKDKDILNVKYDTTMDSIDTCRNDIRDAVREIQKEEENTAVSSARDICVNLRKQVNELDSKFSDYHPPYTKEELEKLMSVLIQSQSILDSLYEFGKKPVSKVTALMLDKKNVSNYINNGLLEYDETLLRPSSLLAKFLKDIGDIPVTCNHTECSLYKTWMEVTNLKKEEEVKRDANDGEEFYKYMDIIYKKLISIFDGFKDVKETIQKLPDDLKKGFISDVILNKIAGLKQIYNREKYNILLTEITEFENFSKLKTDLIAAETTYNLLSKSSNIEYLKTRRDKLEDQELELTKKLKSYLEDISDINEKIEEFSTELEDLEVLIESLTEKDEVEANLKRSSELVNNYLDLSDSYRSDNDDLQSVSSKLSKTRDSHNRMLALYSEFNSTKKDLDKISSLYNENFYIRRSMSAKEGIPLEYINIYMSNIKTTINELLDLVYDGNLYIDDFKINSDEFRIPYVKDGYPIDDIVSASQGETAFLSIALSFALIAESILKYNIVLLDEVDGNLDDEKRKRFIAVLERLMDLIGSEQVFLITHNNLFSMYPVDVISLDGNENDSMKLANYIEVITD